MARLDTRTGENEGVAIPQPYQSRPLTLQSPWKPPRGGGDLASARPQRSLKLQHVDSLLLPKLIYPMKTQKPSLDNSKSVQGPELPRSTPGRRSKREARYEAGDDSGADSTLETIDTEWIHGESNFEDDSTDDDDSQASPAPWLKTDRLPRKTMQSSPASGPANGRLRTIDAASLQSQDEKSSIDGQKRQDIAVGNAWDSITSDHEYEAILRFSPPHSKRPLKKPPSSRPSTPPPPQSPAKSRLTSPKKLQTRPLAPHRQSLDAFWSAEVINTWNDEYSPRKTLKSPRKQIISIISDEEDSFAPQTSPRKKKQRDGFAKTKKAAAEAKKAFERSKHATADLFLWELDEKITEGRIGQLSTSTGGVKILWSKKLNSTAGRAHWRREAIKSPQSTTANSRMSSEPGTTNSEAQTVQTSYRHHASIELAEKVIDDQTRLLNVVAHEFCHLANFMVSGVKDQPHGSSFKRWAALVSKAFAERDVVVTTKHSYEIKYKYAWACHNAECGVEYARHSRSIDPKKHTCGKCRGRLEQIRPVPRKGGNSGDAEGGGNKTAYQQFVKEQFAAVRNELGQQSPMKDVMREIGARYRTKKNGSAGQEQNKDGQSELGAARSTDSDGALQDIDDIRSDVEVEDGGHAYVDNIARVLDFLTLSDD